MSFYLLISPRLVPYMIESQDHIMVWVLKVVKDHDARDGMPLLWRHAES